MNILSSCWIGMQKAVMAALEDAYRRREHLVLLRSVSQRPKGKCGYTKQEDDKCVYPEGTRQLLADDVKGLMSFYKNEYRAVGATSRGIPLRDLHTLNALA